MGSQDNGVSLTVLLNVWAGDDVRRLEKSLESVFSQTLRSFDFLIVSDGPLPSETEVLIRKFKNRDSLIRMKHVRSFPQAGLWHVRNFGIELIQTKYTALHDADDIMHPERLEIQLDSMNKEAIDVLGSSILEFDPNTELITGFRAAPESHSDIRKTMKAKNPMNHSSVMLRTSVLNENTRYRNVYLTEDYDLWIRLITQGLRFKNEPRPLVAFCHDSNMIARRGGRKFVVAERHILQVKVLTGLTNPLEARLYFLMRLAYRIGPRVFRLAIHSRMLNSSVDTSVQNVKEFEALTYSKDFGL